MRRTFTLVFATLLACNAAYACSKSRADVKQLKDAGAQNIPAESVSSTLAELVGLPRPSNAELKAAEHQRLGSEQKLYRLTASVLQSNFELDGDIKLHLADPIDSSKIMLVEIPEPECMAPHYRAQVAQVRADLKRLLKGDAHASRPVLTLTGVAFWGFVKRNEAAPNGIQLHPILKVEDAGRH